MEVIKSKFIIYVDLDGVLADFDRAIGRLPGEKYIDDPPQMYEQGFFRSLQVIPGAKEFVAELEKFENLELFIASKPVTKHEAFYSTIEKYQWVQEHFPSLVRKIFLVCDKGHLRGDYLIDDDLGRWGEKFRGHFLHFNTEKPEESWKTLLYFFNMRFK